MFLTKSKDKIPQTLSYPVHAKQISDALFDVPQAADLAIHFSFGHDVKTALKKGQSYAVLTIQYFYWTANRFAPVHISPQPNWGITVQPVQRAVAHRIKELILREAMPKIRSWLLKHPETDGKPGFKRLCIYYDDLKDELTWKE